MKNIFTNLICLGVLLASAWSWQGCNVINPHEQIPTYIHVDSFVFNENPILRGVTTSAQITTVWAYYNNNFIGTFDLPANIPVVTKNDTATGTLILAPGVAVNGLNNSLSSYPFYRGDNFTFQAQPGKVINHVANTTFFDNVKVTSIANFDAAATGFALSVGNIPITVVGPPDNFEGQNSGAIILTSPGDSSVDSTIKVYPVPYGQTAFLEFNYKTSVPFYVGIQSNQGVLISTSAYYLAGISPSDHWQKFYLFLGDFINTYQGTDYNFYIKASIPSGSASGGGKLLIDNIQIVTF